jgi:hypothetical protein
MNGIIKNINNPFIVITILYDYFKIKQNNYFAVGNLVSTIKNFYKGLKLMKIQKGKIKKSFFRFSKRLEHKLEIFRFGLDISFGYDTYDNFRKLLCNHITNELYAIPNQ